MGKLVYVASPYTGYSYFSIELCKIFAKAYVDSARSFYECRGERDNKFFSPVLELAEELKGVSYDVAMDECYARLSKCDEIFFNRNVTKGMFLEYKFARANNINTVFLFDEDRKFYEIGEQNA